jgi:hypothetical protein
VVFGFGLAPGNAGFARSVSVGPPWSPDIALGLSSATISAPHLGSARCNSAGVLAADESVARTLSADNGGSAAGEPIASADPLDFRDDL